MISKTRCKTVVLSGFVMAVALILGSFTTNQYVKARGFSYLEETQIKRHMAVIEGRAGNPWQYRLLAPRMLEAVMRLFGRINISHHIAVSFIFFRVVQDTLLLLLAFMYYWRLGLSLPHALLGMILLAWGMSHSHYDSDLQFNTFFDVVFYLSAGWSILKKRYVLIIPITVLGALNRETSGLIPLLPLASVMYCSSEQSIRKVIPICVVALLSYIVIYLGLRQVYGEQMLIVPYGYQPGIQMLRYNFFRLVTWEQLMATLSLIPIMALIGYKTWPLELRGFFWVMVPIWLVIHALGAVMAEARLFLVPQAMVFIPGALFLAQTAKGASTEIRRNNLKH